MHFCFKICFNLKGIIQLEKELANLGGSCAAALMKKDLALPIGKSYLKNLWYFTNVQVSYLYFFHTFFSLHSPPF